jgi:hypothetical protein
MKYPRQRAVLAVLGLLQACATPSTDVKIPTLSMADANRQSSSGADAAASVLPRISEARLVQSVVNADRPVPVLTPPDVRLAYVYSWVDADGTVHYPSWTAIAVKDFQWVIPGLGTVPMNGTAQQVPPQPEKMAKPIRPPPPISY